MNIPNQRITRQHGAVLVFSLIILLIMTLVGLSAMQNTTLEEKMAGNYKDQNLSFQSAESTLREGEDWLTQLNTEPQLSTVSCSVGCDVWEDNILLTAVGAALYTDEALWSDTRAKTATITTPVNVTQPQYYIEFEMDQRDSLNIGQQQDNSVRIYYSIVAQGFGASPSTQTILQSTYTRRF